MSRLFNLWTSIPHCLLSRLVEFLDPLVEKEPRVPLRLAPADILPPAPVSESRR